MKALFSVIILSLAAIGQADGYSCESGWTPLCVQQLVEDPGEYGDLICVELSFTSHYVAGTGSCEDQKYGEFQCSAGWSPTCIFDISTIMVFQDAVCLSVQAEYVPSTRECRKPASSSGPSEGTNGFGGGAFKK